MALRLWLLTTVLYITCAVQQAHSEVTAEGHADYPTVKLHNVGLERNRVKRKIYSFENYPQRKWRLPIKYYIDTNSSYFINSTTVDEAEIIDDVLTRSYQDTCISFKKLNHPEAATDPDPYLFFSDNGDIENVCEGYVGRLVDSKDPSSDVISNQQRIALGRNCFFHPHLIVKLTSAALGLFGEQARPDRDRHVEIFSKLIQSQYISMFTKRNSTQIDINDIPYDLGSLMQAAPQEYSRTKSDSIVPRDPNMKRLMGQAVGLSYYDVMALNSAYCQACSTNRNCNYGFPHPSDCNRCVCVDGFASPDCRTVIPGQCYPTGSTLTATDQPQCFTHGQGSNYADGEMCSWIIDAPSGYLVQFWFEGEVKLPYYSQSNACYHWVEIKYNGTDTPRGPRYCGDGGSNTPTTERPLISYSRNVMVIFKSNTNHEQVTPFQQQRGFKLCFTHIVGPASSAAHGLSSKDQLMIIVVVLLVLLIVIALLLIGALMYRRKRRRPQAQQGPIPQPTAHTNPGYLPPAVVYIPTDDEKAKLEKELQEITMISGPRHYPDPPPQYEYGSSVNPMYLEHPAYITPPRYEESDAQNLANDDANSQYTKLSSVSRESSEGTRRSRGSRK